MSETSGSGTPSAGAIIGNWKERQARAKHLGLTPEDIQKSEAAERQANLIGVASLLETYAKTAEVNAVREINLSKKEEPSEIIIPDSFDETPRLLQVTEEIDETDRLQRMTVNDFLAELGNDTSTDNAYHWLIELSPHRLSVLSDGMMRGTGENPLPIADAILDRFRQQPDQIVNRVSELRQLLEKNGDITPQPTS